jgi:hypothetical protein
MSDNPKEPDSNRQQLFKDAYLLFFAVILGAIGADLINAYFANYHDWVLLAITVVYLLVASLIVTYLIYFLIYTLPKRKIRRIKIKPFLRAHRALAVFYIFMIIVSILAAVYCSELAFASPTQNLTKGPISINAEQQVPINGTLVTINIPAQTISVAVNFNFVSQTKTLFIWVLLPYTISSVQNYALVNNVPYGEVGYPLSYVGTFSTYFMNSTLGSSILNSTLELNQTSFQFFPSGEIIGLGVSINIKDSLLAVDDSAGGSKSAIYTFYGDETGIWTNDMIPYIGSNTFPTFNEPFTVVIGLPSSYYYSSSQPPPIEYYLKEKNRLIMFSMDFLNGQYAQTLVVNLENPTAQSNRELYIFLVGVFVTLPITFIPDVVKEIKSAHGKTNGNIHHE